jgi:predicted nucleotidyltransferase
MRKEIQRILEYFEKRREVVALFLFGTFDTEKERPDSDIDLAVLIDPQKTKDNSYEMLKAEYYNTSPDFSLLDVDIVILNAAPTSLKYEILKTGRILLDRNPDLRRLFTALTLQEYFDYKIVEDIYFNALKKRLRAVYG